MEEDGDGRGQSDAVHPVTAERELVERLQSFERWFFAQVIAGSMAKKIYRLYEMTF